MRRVLPLALLCLGIAGMIGTALALAAAPDRSDLKYKNYMPLLSKAEPTPTPTPTPEPPPYQGHIASIYLASARLFGQDPISEQDTRSAGGRELFQDPTNPAVIATYPRFGRPGFRAGNTVFAAHINYVNYGNGPFAYITSASVDDALYVTMDNGLVYTYSVKSIDVIPLSELDMNPIVYPPLDSHTERVTLISCGGDFVPNPSGYGGEYGSRVILVAERYIP